MSSNRRKNSKTKQKFSGFTSELNTTATELRYASFEEVIRSIPKGRVATYGQVAEAAGYPRGHRLVARFLRDMSGLDLPWQRVVGAGGAIKTMGRGAAKQRSLLKGEGVGFAGARIDMDLYGHIFDF